MKKTTILGSSLLSVGLLLGSLNISAASAQEEFKPDINNYEVNHKGEVLLAIEPSATGVGAFLAGAVVGGLVYDGVKWVATKYADVYKEHGSTMNENWAKYCHLAGGGAESIDNDYSLEFGR